MKKPFLILILAAVAFSVVSILTRITDSTAPEEHQNSFPDGPDKAALRDYWMMHDPFTGSIPGERLAEQKVTELAARLDSDRDFNWQNYDTGRPGRGRFIFHEPQSGSLFSGSVSGGLYVNNNYADNGGRWEKVGTFPDLSVSCIAADPTNPNRLFIGTGESYTAFLNYRESTGLGTGIFVSEDRGVTWSPISSTQGFTFINDIVIREENGSGVIYAAVGSGTYKSSTFVQEGLYRSTDYGTSWSQVLPDAVDNDLYQVSDIELSSDNTLYVGTMRNGSNNRNGGYILKSSNGTSWQLIDFIASELEPRGGYPGRMIIKSSLQNPDHIYILATNGYYNGLEQLRDYEVYLYQSYDAGSNWSSLPLPAEQWANIPWHALALAVDPANQDRIIIGALNLYILNNTANLPGVEEPWAPLTRWYAMYEVDRAQTPEDKAYWESIYVHGDIHDIRFYQDNPDHILISTDGGVFATTNLSAIHNYNYEVPSEGQVKFNQVSLGLNTTQYYAIDISPTEGKYDFLGGTQDNGSIYTTGSGNVFAESWISGGDGGYVFFDEDDPDLKITSVYGNRWYLHTKETTYFTNWVDGLFVNPADYDDESNLLYTNPSTSPNGGLYPHLRGRFYDSLRIINVNKYLKTDDLQLDTTFYLGLNGGIDEAITAIKLSEYGDKLDRTLFLGTEYGKVYRVDGLPYNPVTTRIDNSQINYGYISSIDIGENNSSVLVTLSNFGIKSVYATWNNGVDWADLERDLPDMPVRWGIFNPFDHFKILVATEMGVWGLENTLDTNEGWKSYNGNMPAIRVDMIKVRASDSTILAGTHGAGMWWGKFDQGEEIVLAVNKVADRKSALYPNPFHSQVRISDPRIESVRIYNLNGQFIDRLSVRENVLDLGFLVPGPYVFTPVLVDGSTLPAERVIKLE